VVALPGNQFSFPEKPGPAQGGIGFRPLKSYFFKCFIFVQALIDKGFVNSL
jgi:hypothetical protein